MMGLLSLMILPEAAAASTAGVSEQVGWYMQVWGAFTILGQKTRFKSSISYLSCSSHVDVSERSV